MKKEKDRFKELDALRGIAAVMVVLFHLTIGHQEAQLGFNLGTTGVDLFFIISGFVISMSIHSVSSASQFAINRVSRLYPTYWASVTFTFVLIAAYGIIKSQSIPWTQYLANMTMFQYYLGVPDLDGPYWTMIVEMNFYIFVLLLFQLNLLRFIIWISLAITIMVGILSNFYWSTSAQALFTTIPLLQFFPLFFAGIIFYEWKQNPTIKYTYLSLLLICLITQSQLYGIAAGRNSFFIEETQYIVMLLICFILFTLFIHDKLGFIINKPLLFLGKISFALYLTHHYILLRHVQRFLLDDLGMNFLIASLLICLPVSIVIASGITYLIESRYSPKLKRWLSRRLIPAPA